MKPIIGISVNYKEQTSRIADAYVQAVQRAGGVPLLIPIMEDSATLELAVRQIDGLLLSGGADIDPSYFNEEAIPELGDVDSKRDFYDYTLIELA
ncbi:MAG TPA: gamma-glutamyl-gamma-aminobutyrate hydrolase family protein, partial [Paludibacteraceae bacterium]|nr:gamma-glutamyl-gamma-aminobutyrate hydrolase family protein [Paludibacteraceae bacterium]